MSLLSWCWRLRYKLSLRDLAEMFLIRGLVFSYEAVRDWEAKLTPALAENLRRRRKGKVGRSWYVDETYIRVRGGWRYLYRAIDRAGALVDVMLSEHRDLAAAKAFFRSAKAVTGVIPDRVTTDGHDAYPRAIRTELGRHVRHRTSRYLNNRLEQDHRGIKGRCRPMLGLKSTGSARRYCCGHDELRNFLRCRSRMRQHVPAATRRWQLNRIAARQSVIHQAQAAPLSPHLARQQCIDPRPAPIAEWCWVDARVCAPARPAACSPRAARPA